MFRNDEGVPIFPENTLLVIGGSPEHNSNRTKEPANLLEPAPLEAQEDFLAGVHAAETEKELYTVLATAADAGYNLVGTRQYVYRLTPLSNIFEHAQFFDIALFPRTAGLRMKVAVLKGLLPKSQVAS